MAITSGCFNGKNCVITISCALIAVAVLTKMKLPGRADLPWFLAAGGIGFFLYMIAFNPGQATVTAATGHGVCQGKADITGQQLYVYHALFDEHSGVSACR